MRWTEAQEETMAGLREAAKLMKDKPLLNQPVWNPLTEDWSVQIDFKLNGEYVAYAVDIRPDGTLSRVGMGGALLSASELLNELLLIAKRRPPGL